MLGCKKFDYQVEIVIYLHGTFSLVLCCEALIDNKNKGLGKSSRRNGQESQYSWCLSGKKTSHSKSNLRQKRANRTQSAGTSLLYKQFISISIGEQSHFLLPPITFAPQEYNKKQNNSSYLLYYEMNI